MPSQHAVAAGSLIEVKAVFALLIQHNVDGSLDIFTNVSRDGHRLDSRLCNNKVEAFHLTCSRCAEGDGHIVRIDRDGLALEACAQRQLHAGTIDSIYLGLFEIQLIGVGNGHQLAADHLAIQHQIYIDLAQALCNEHTILRDGCPGFITDSPGSTLGNIHSVAAGADADGTHLHCGTDGGIVVLTCDVSVIECGRAGSSGVDQQVGGNVTGIAVGGAVHNGQLIAAGLACHKGGGAAAVQVDGDDTASLSHDVTNILQACAAGEGLTTVDTHQDHTAGSSNTNGGAGCIAGSCAADDLAVLDHELAEATDGFLDAAGIHQGLVLIVSAHVSGAVIHNGEEACAAFLGIPLDAVHNEQTAGSSHIRHIVTTCIGGSDNGEVGDIIGAVGIAVTVLCVLCGAGNGVVFPLGVLRSTGIAVIVVDPQTHIVTVYIGSCDIEHDLPAIGIGGIADLLGNTGSQDLGFGIVNSVTGILQILHVVTGQAAHLICEGIANSLAQLSQLIAGSVEVTGTLQSSDQLVAGISVIHSSTQILTGAQTIQTVIQQVFYTLLQSQALGEILAHHSLEIAGLVAVVDQLACEVEAFQVSIQVVAAECTGRTGLVIIEQIVLTNILDLLFQSQVCGHTEFVGGAQQVGQVTYPAAHVSVVLAALVVVGHIHRAEEVATQDLQRAVLVNIDFAVGVEVGIQLLQTGNIDPHVNCGIGVDGILCLLNKLQEVLILGTCHDCPGTGGVVCHTGTQIVQDQAQGIFVGMRLHILCSHHFQIADVGHKLIQSSDLLDFYLGNFDVTLGILAAEFAGMGLVLIQGLHRIAQQAVVMGRPADCAVGCLLGLTVHPLMLQHRNGICIIFAVHAVTCASLVTDSSTSCLDFRLCNDPCVLGHGDLDLSHQDLTAITAMRAIGQTGGGTSCEDTGIHDHLMLLLGIEM